MRIIAVILWSIVFAKELLLWIWLWQLKEYHIGRFKAHFQTEKGKKLIKQNLILVKLFLLVGLVFYPEIFLYFFILLFAIETFFVLVRFLQKKLRVPVITKKTIILLSGGFLFELFFVYSILNAWTAQKFFYVYLVILDLTAPLFISGLVMGFEPFAVSWRKNLIKKATEKRKKFTNLIVIGITGSYGKTSTKEFLADILSEKFNVLKTKKHQNSEVGVSQCIINDLDKEHQVFICEMGAYNKGGIKLLADIAKPKIGILTGINQQHLATFGSLENIIKTKYELIEGLPSNGLAVFNGSNKYCRELFDKAKIAKKMTQKDIWADDVEVGKDFISFRVVTKNSQARLKINLLGKHWIDNILMAILVAQELGMSMEEISHASRKIRPLDKGMKLIRAEKGFNIIDATYSANPDGVVAHLDYLKVWKGKKAIVMPCLIELGSEASAIHKKIGKEIAKVCDLAIITTKEYFDSIKKEAVANGMDDKNVLLMENPRDIFEKISDFNKEEDVILLESRIPKGLYKSFGLA